ncbi:A disintegrin and metalloproteinase with thrombospondin motifs 12 [Manduca sexta]|uniref:A disintegrin and metalloproteinase with thrombospondin motifs 12 n=1 Tax=Manduca sexta TaxID=7130 RepID=UPI001890284C|nr:A disintegrin and metalloproteinase with thrombospondin motifs 12 [Manduca sexta]XP_030020101.2 A disintegrin and metalloproteinase with thrombospondin motifs 12 [Manduca sexta]
MCASDYVKMEVRCSLFKLLLFQMLVAWCGAKHVTIGDVPESRLRVDADDQDVQDSIRNLVHTGIYSHRHLDPSQVQVVHPVKVTSDGALVSRTVQHAHEHGHARARRDLHATEHLQPHSLHYNLTVDGRPIRLDLRPSVTFITPAMIIERHGANERTRHRPSPEATACHYTGSVRGQPTSRVALSACDGLAGLLQTEHGEYWIEPSNQRPADSSEGRPHVIFKRSAVDKVAAFHREKRAVDDNTNHNNNENKLHEKDNTRYPRRKGNGKGSHESKEDRDRRRRNYLEKRQKELAAMRRNPVEYRRQHPNLRMEERRMHSHSKSNSVEGSISGEPRSVAPGRRNHNNKTSFERRMRRLKNRRKKRQTKNCATKQPLPYLWKEKNLQSADMEEFKKARNGKHNRRYNHHNMPRRMEYDNSRRSTRSVSKPRHVEVLLVADRSMSKFHNQESLETYLLTIMNMVSSLYMDPSIGNYIKVVVVKIILVEHINAAEELHVTTNADMTLASFCRWQQQLNPDDDTNPHHHDVAILVTREDICSQHDTPCSTLGVAHVAGMCKPDRSCSVNEDNGIMLAHTITHELGHNFGLYHDTEKIGCHRREGSTLHIMTPIFEADTVQVAWSRCSKRDVTNFLDAGLGECLSDKPSQEEYYEYPEVPAGVTFDADSQCHLQFGAEAVVCAKPSELCEHLWCLVNNTCKTMLRSAAPGTTCGPDMWCQNQTCVPRTPSPAPRNGDWGPWSEWSECSRTCGAGVSTQSRECNNPEPYNNGNYCIGDRSRYKVCNTDPCPINEPTFREVQCSRHNNITHDRDDTYTEWVPYFDQDKPCDLLCVPRDGNETEMLGGFVADGTPCRQTAGSRDMCIAGVCYKVGCDWIVNSDAEKDACGVCGGDGSACKTVQGIYNKGTTRQSGFSEVAVIPAGSRNVKIQEKVSPGNYISIASAKSKKMYLNGARNATLTEYFVAGAQAIYERDRDWEKVRISGPISEDIKVYQRIFRGRHRNPGVAYQYTVDRQQLQNQFSYRLSDWTPCSVTCGIGYTRRYYECVDSKRRVVEQSQCYHIESPRHDALMQRCRQPACPPAPAPKYTHWWVGAWSPCSKPCHMPGEQATKQRNVYCVDKLTYKVVEDFKCDLASKPITTIICADIPAC